MEKRTWRLDLWAQQEGSSHGPSNWYWTSCPAKREEGDAHDHLMQKERKDKWPEKREHIILDSWQEIKTLDLQSYATPDADTLISKPCPVFYQGFYWINHWWLATIDWAVKMQPVRMRDLYPGAQSSFFHFSYSYPWEVERQFKTLGISFFLFLKK